MIAANLSSSGSDSDREDAYEDTGIQGPVTDMTQVQNFMVDENAQDYQDSYNNAVAMAQVEVAEYDDQGEDSFDPNAFFSSFANKEQQEQAQQEQEREESEQQAQQAAADINNDLQLSDSGSDSDFEEVNNEGNNNDQSDNQEYDLDDLMQFQEED